MSGPAADVIARAERVRLAVFDVDGVLTDGRLLLGDNGVEYKAFFTRDGHGMKMLRSTGVELAVLTGRRSRVVAERMASLGLVHVYQGYDEKLPVFEELLGELALEPEQAAYVGDDVVDLPVMRRAGLAIAVADAHPMVREHAHWCTHSVGGRGAVREVCELIMTAQGNLDDLVRSYLDGVDRADSS